MARGGATPSPAGPPSAPPLTADDAAADVVVAALRPDCWLIRCRTETKASARLNEVQVQLAIVDAEALADHTRNMLVSARVSHPLVARIVICAPDRAGRCGQIARRAAALYLLKPVPKQQIRLAASRALELTELSRRHRLLPRELRTSISDELFTGREDIAPSVKGGRRASRSWSMSTRRWRTCAPRRDPLRAPGRPC